MLVLGAGCLVLTGAWARERDWKKEELVEVVLTLEQHVSPQWTRRREHVVEVAPYSTCVLLQQQQRGAGAGRAGRAETLHCGLSSENTFSSFRTVSLCARVASTRWCAPHRVVTREVQHRVVVLAPSRAARFSKRCGKKTAILVQSWCGGLGARNALAQGQRGTRGVCRSPLREENNTSSAYFPTGRAVRIHACVRARSASGDGGGRCLCTAVVRSTNETCLRINKYSQVRRFDDSRKHFETGV